MRTAFTFLSLFSLPFLIETAYEMYWLTWLHGPQMLLFALFHGAGGPILFYSWLLGGLVTPFFLLVSYFLLGAKLLKRTAYPAVPFYWSAVGAAIVTTHLALFFLYERWSPLFANA